MVRFYSYAFKLYVRIGSFQKELIQKLADILLFGTLDYLRLFAFLFNPIPTRLYHMIYYHGDEKYSYLVGIGLKTLSTVEVVHL